MIFITTSKTTLQNTIKQYCGSGLGLDSVGPVDNGPPPNKKRAEIHF